MKSILIVSALILSGCSITENAFTKSLVQDINFKNQSTYGVMVTTIKLAAL